MATSTLSMPAQEVYFLQDLVLFNHEPTQARIETIKAEWKEIVQRRHEARNEMLRKLQVEADRLKHRIDVADVLAHALA